jgi:hypothetical protein
MNEFIGWDEKRAEALISPMNEFIGWDEKRAEARCEADPKPVSTGLPISAAEFIRRRERAGEFIGVVRVGCEQPVFFEKTGCSRVRFQELF